MLVGAYEFSPEGFAFDVACDALEGDPHIITLDGLHYDFQAAGELRYRPR